MDTSVPWDSKEGSGFNYDPHIDYGTATYVGEMDVKCTHCSALKFRGESKGKGCAETLPHPSALYQHIKR